MKKIDNAASPSHGYLLSEENHEQLAKLRDQILLMANVVYANTLEEEQEPLQIPRSMLGLLLESYGSRIDEVLGRLDGARRRH